MSGEEKKTSVPQVRPERTITIPMNFPMAAVFALRHWAKLNNVPLDELKITVEVPRINDKCQWQDAIVQETNPLSDLQMYTRPLGIAAPFMDEEFVQFWGINVRLISTEKSREYSQRPVYCPLPPRFETDK